MWGSEPWVSSFTMSLKVVSLLPTIEEACSLVRKFLHHEFESIIVCLKCNVCLHNLSSTFFQLNNTVSDHGTFISEAQFFFNTDIKCVWVTETILSMCEQGQRPMGTDEEHGGSILPRTAIHSGESGDVQWFVIRTNKTKLSLSLYLSPFVCASKGVLALLPNSSRTQPFGASRKWYIVTYCQYRQWARTTFPAKIKRNT